jgi:hypothetical protein
MEEKFGKPGLCYCCLLEVRRRVVWYKCIEISQRLTSSIKTLFTLLTKATGNSETSTTLYQNKSCCVREDSVHPNHH